MRKQKYYTRIRQTPMKKQINYTEKGFRTIRKIAIIITSIYVFMECIPCLLALMNDILHDKDLLSCINISSATMETILFVGMCCWYFWPILIIVSWAQCLDDYLHLKLRTSSWKNDVKYRKKVYVSIGLMSVLGIFVFFQLRSMLLFLSDNWSDSAKLLDCIILKVIILACWLFIWIYSIRKRILIEKNQYKKSG